MVATRAPALTPTLTTPNPPPNPHANQVRRDMWLSVWTGFVLTHLLINRVIKPFWFHRQREVFVRPFDSRME